MTMEPKPENIAGEVVHRHAFEHRIDWGHVAIAVAAVAIVVTLFGSDVESVGESDMESVGESDVESDSSVFGR